MSTPEHYDEIKTTVLDTRTVKAKQLASDKVNVKGKDIKDIIGEAGFKPEDLLSRMKIEDGEYYVLWDDKGQPVKVNAPASANIAKNTTGITTINWDLSKMTSGYYAFTNCTSLKKFGPVHLPNLNDNISYMFSGCTLLESVDILSTRNVTGSYGMFQNCEKLKSININLPNTTSIGTMFYGCKSLTSIEQNFSKATDTYGTFMKCSSLETVNLDLSAATSLGNTFSECKNLKNVTLNAPNLTSCNWTFEHCSSLSNAPEIDYSKLVDTLAMFYGCKSLKSFEKDISLSKNCNGMFCYGDLETFKADTSSMEHAETMFFGCNNLKTVEMDLTSLINAEYMFTSNKLDDASCKNLIWQLRNKNNVNEIYLNRPFILNISSALANDPEFLEICGLEKIQSGKSFTIPNLKGVLWTVILGIR